MNNFQIVLISIFLAFFAFAVLIFSGIINIGGDTTQKIAGNVVIWGTMPASVVSPIIDNLNVANQDLVIRYQEKNKTTYENDLLNAFAAGTAPDLFMIDNTLVFKEQDRVFKIPYATYPQKTFTDTYIDGGNIFLSKDGIIALPMIVDPVVLYYNKDILSNEAIAKPPVFWDELFDIAPQLTKKSSDGAITQSAIALGTPNNIKNAKDIIATLAFQAGNPVSLRDANDRVTTQIAHSNGAITYPPLDSVMNFFVEFSNPSLSAYSWNRAMPEARSAFTAGKLAFYIGHSSELLNIQDENPYLSFDTTPILQARDAAAKRTFGTITALAISKTSTNQAGAYDTLTKLSNPEILKTLSKQLYLPPARKDALAEKPTDPYLSSFYNSAIISRAWIDPDTKATDAIFTELISNIISNKSDASSSLSKAQGQIDALIK